MAPTVHFYQFSSSGQNPAGSRHLTSHASFIKSVNATASGLLDFGSLNIDNLAHCATKALLFRTSALNGATRIENMRFWAPSLPAPGGTISYNMKIMTPYVSGISLTTASGVVPTSLPSSANLLRTDGNSSI